MFDLGTAHGEHLLAELAVHPRPMADQCVPVTGLLGQEATRACRTRVDVVILRVTDLQEEDRDNSFAKGGKRKLFHRATCITLASQRLYHE